MPTIGSFHGNFWDAKTGAAPAVTASEPSQYPAWQASIVSVSFFGVSWEYATHLWDVLCWHGRMLKARLHTQRHRVVQWRIMRQRTDG